MAMKKHAQELGWILIHSLKEWEDEGTPGDELKRRKKSKNGSFPWEWKRRMNPRAEDFTLLFAEHRHGDIVGEATANITRSKRKGYKIAFLIRQYRPATRHVRLEDVVGRTKARDLIKLTPRILGAYRRKANR
jgi:hypothetical protein